MAISLGVAFSGLAAGAITGLFGAGGGMVLVPLLTAATNIEDHQIFPASISMMLPICLTALLTTAAAHGVDWIRALPYLLGSVLGGYAAGKWGSGIPLLWLHRGLGILIIWGGIRYLC